VKRRETSFGIAYQGDQGFSLSALAGHIIKSENWAEVPLVWSRVVQFVVSRIIPLETDEEPAHSREWKAYGSRSDQPSVATRSSLLGPFTTFARVMPEGLAFRSKGSIGVSGRRRRERALSNRPIGLTDPGLVLVRGPDYRTSRMRERLDHECQTCRCSQTYRRTTCDDERCGTTQGPLLVGADNDQGRGSQQGRRQAREAWLGS
jgi:hypothetical protein